MANLFKLCSFICILLLATTLATSARILDETNTQFPFPGNTDPTITDPPITTTNPDNTPAVAPVTTLPSGQFPATPTTNDIAPITPTEPIAPNSSPDTPDQPIAPVVAPPVTATVSPVTTPAPALPSGGVATMSDHPTLSFFMHDILGGSQPSGRAVAGILSNTDANNLPFSKPNNQIFPINGGVPLNTINGVVNNNNLPFLVGLNGSPTNTIVQNNGNNVVSGNNNNQAFVTAGQLPAGLTVQQLTFGSVTVVDNEITEGHELGSAVLGKAQGLYLTSSTDGSSHTLALTAMFHGSDHEVDDTVSFFGVHRTATPISHIAIIGGTGKYENAKGFATIEAIPHVDQHLTDGVETITHFTLYLTP